jgi:hypothetical protein
MGKKKSGKSVSTIPKEFIPYARRGFQDIEARRGQPLAGVTGQGGVQQQLGITPGVDVAGLERARQPLNAALPDVSRLFGAGAGQQGRTIAGGYLDPTQTGAYRNLESSLRDTGSETYEKLLDQARQGAARSGTFRSSAREGQESSAARGVARDITSQLAQAGTGLYSQERAAQEAAAGRGVAGLPDVAGQVFGQAQGINSAQIQDIQSRLAAAGGGQELRDADIKNMIAMLGALGGTREGGGGGGGIPGLGLVSALLK